MVGSRVQGYGGAWYLSYSLNYLTTEPYYKYGHNSPANIVLERLTFYSLAGTEGQSLGEFKSFASIAPTPVSEWVAPYMTPIGSTTKPFRGLTGSRSAWKQRD